MHSGSTLRYLDLSTCWMSLKSKYEHTVASPLSKERDEAVAQDSIGRPAVLEQRPVIPPSLIRTIHLQTLLVLHQLELDPLAVRVPSAVVLCERGDCLVALSAGVMPARRLGEEESAKRDDAGEHELETDGDHPGGVAFVGEATAGSTAGDEGSDGPHDVVETPDDAAVGWMGCLDDIGRAGGGHDGDAEP